MRNIPQIILFSFLSVTILVSFFVVIPTAVLPVNGQVISDDWKGYLESYLLEVDENTTAEIVIYVLDSLYGHGIMKDGVEINDKVQLGVYIFNELELDTPYGSVVGLGKAEKNNGILILVAMQDREWRIEIGYGLEGYITDVESYRIANSTLVPKFQKGLYGEGFADLVYALAQEIPSVNESERMSTRGRYVYDGAQSSQAYDNEETPWWVIVIIVIFVLIMIKYGGYFGGLGRGRRHGGWGGGYGGGGGSGGGGGGGGSGGGGSGGGW
ncbi:MAG: TPM domain-containing protein [Candidatus Bathyarchaeum tardum]|nr:MAG: TPM domain-containing protein [Candidatus Bathyarchaeum tardum]